MVRPCLPIMPAILLELLLPNIWCVRYVPLAADHPAIFLETSRCLEPTFQRTTHPGRGGRACTGARAIGLAAMDKDGKIVPYAFTRRQPGATDITIQIAYVRVLTPFRRA